MNTWHVKTIEPITPVTGEPFSFFVASASRSRVVHLVHLDENDFNGWCSCEHFAMRCGPALDSGEPPGAKTRCRHIELARGAWFDMVARKIGAGLGFDHRAKGRMVVRRGNIVYNLNHRMKYEVRS